MATTATATKPSSVRCEWCQFPLAPLVDNPARERGETQTTCECLNNNEIKIGANELVVGSRTVTIYVCPTIHADLEPVTRRNAWIWADQRNEELNRAFASLIEGANEDDNEDDDEDP